MEETRLAYNSSVFNSPTDIHFSEHIYEGIDVGGLNCLPHRPTGLTVHIWHRTTLYKTLLILMESEIIQYNSNCNVDSPFHDIFYTNQKLWIRKGHL